MTSLQIPKILHTVWVGSPMPRHLDGYVATWRDKHPDWERMHWGDLEIAGLGLVNRAQYDDAEDLVPADAVGQLRADLARYEILHAYGGLYVDCDTECLRNVEPALAGVAAFAAWEDRNYIGNTYLACTRGHAIMADLTAMAPDSIRRHRGKRPNRMTGPRYLTPLWRAAGLQAAPSRRWFPYSYRDVKAGTVPFVFDSDVYAVHHWEHTRSLIASHTAGR